MSFLKALIASTTTILLMKGVDFCFNFIPVNYVEVEENASEIAKCEGLIGNLFIFILVMSFRAILPAMIGIKVGLLGNLEDWQNGDGKSKDIVAMAIAGTLIICYFFYDYSSEISDLAQELIRTDRPLLDSTFLDIIFSYGVATWFMIKENWEDVFAILCVVVTFLQGAIDTYHGKKNLKNSEEEEI